MTTRSQPRRLRRPTARLVGLIAMFVITEAGRAQAIKNEVTFAKDIAPILQRSCQTCHRPGNIGPMSLLTYQDVRPWARAIKATGGAAQHAAVVHDRAVGIQKFKNDPSLSDQEIADDFQVGGCAERQWAIRPTCRLRASSTIATAGTSASPTSSSR